MALETKMQTFLKAGLTKALPRACCQVLSSAEGLVSWMARSRTTGRTCHLLPSLPWEEGQGAGRKMSTCAARHVKRACAGFHQTAQSRRGLVSSGASTVRAPVCPSHRPMGAAVERDAVCSRKASFSLPDEHTLHPLRLTGTGLLPPHCGLN